MSSIRCHEVAILSRSYSLFRVVRPECRTAHAVTAIRLEVRLDPRLNVDLALNHQR
jgi:hypothetical protein